jgi:hypothetical protein
MSHPAESLHDPLPLLRACVAAMQMQMGRESAELHIERPMAQKIWVEALNTALAAIAYHDERAKDVVIDLDAEAWRMLKEAILTSPRFQEMYRAGGLFQDACSSVESWLAQEQPELLEEPDSGCLLSAASR